MICKSLWIYSEFLNNYFFYFLLRPEPRHIQPILWHLPELHRRPELRRGQGDPSQGQLLRRALPAGIRCLDPPVPEEPSGTRGWTRQSSRQQLSCRRKTLSGFQGKAAIIIKLAGVLTSWFCHRYITSSLISSRNPPVLLLPCLTVKNILLKKPIKLAFSTMISCATHGDGSFLYP